MLEQYPEQPHITPGGFMKVRTVDNRDLHFLVWH